VNLDVDPEGDTGSSSEGLEEVQASLHHCIADSLDRVALAGELPVWVDWPAPFVAVEDAELLIRTHDHDDDGRYHLDVLALGDGAPELTAELCLQAQLWSERGARLDALGIAARPATIVELELPDPEVERRRFTLPDLSLPGLGLLVAVLFILVTAAVDAAPTARQSGFLESLLVQRVRRRDVFLAWWLEGVLLGAAVAALFLLGLGATALASGEPLPTVPWVATVVLVAVAPAAIHPFLIDAPSYRSGTLRTVLVVYGVMGLVGAAWGLQAVAPLLGAAVPIGGLGLSMLGLTEPAGTAVAVASAVAAGIAGAALAVRALRTLDISAGALGRTARRRAAGRYGPEVALLMLMALAATTTWMPASFAADRPQWAVLLAQVLFFAVPAVGISRYLGLDARAVLQWRAPPLVIVALAPLIAAGTLSLAYAITRLTAGWFPDPSVGPFAETMEKFATPSGVALIILLPAVCEELLFRGAMLGLLRRSMPVWAAIAIQAALFGAVHLMAFRVLPTAVLGVVLGLLVWRTRSLLPAMVVHALHNAGALWLAHRGWG